MPLAKLYGGPVRDQVGHRDLCRRLQGALGSTLPSSPPGSDRAREELSRAETITAKLKPLPCRTSTSRSLLSGTETIVRGAETMSYSVRLPKPKYPHTKHRNRNFFGLGGNPCGPWVGQSDSREGTAEGRSPARLANTCVFPFRTARSSSWARPWTPTMTSHTSTVLDDLRWHQQVELVTRAVLCVRTLR